MTDNAAERRHVLVVDDDGEICRLIDEALLERGFATTCVGADHEAHTALGGGQAFAALIVDINLGEGTTGYDVARFARQRAPAIPVLYISGQSPEASFRIFGVRGSMFLQKPFKAAALAAHLDALIDLTREPVPGAG